MKQNVSGSLPQNISWEMYNRVGGWHKSAHLTLTISMKSGAIGARAVLPRTCEVVLLCLCGSASGRVYEGASGCSSV